MKQNNLVFTSDYVLQVKRATLLEPKESYTILGLRLYGNGLFKREIKLGRDIKSKKLFQVKKGDFIYSRLFAWRGSFAVVTEEFDGCFVSNEFPCFIEKNNDVLSLDYLLLYFLLPSTLVEVEKLCTGTTKGSRNRFNEKKFFPMQFPLIKYHKQLELVEYSKKIKKIVTELKEEVLEVEENSTNLIYKILNDALNT